MKKFISKILQFSIALVFFFLSIVLYNLWLDPFGVIREDMHHQITEPNQHYIKTKHILNNPQKFNAFLFGSSRVEKINVSKINDSNNWYNFSYSEAVPSEILEDIKLLIKNKIKIKKIIIGLDEFSYMVSPQLHLSQSLRKPYKNSLNPFLSYLFLQPSYSMYKTIKDTKSDKFYQEGVYATIYETGNFYPNKKDDFIINNKNTHMKDSIFNKPYWCKYYNERITKTISEINKINKLCQTNKIEIIFLINPIFSETYLKAVDNHFFKFLRKLSEIVPFYDFSGINKITTNKLNYYEASHYRPIVGDFIIQNIFFDKNSTNYIVTEKNIDSIISNKQIKYDKVRMYNNALDSR